MFRGQQSAHNGAAHGPLGPVAHFDAGPREGIGARERNEGLHSVIDAGAGCAGHDHPPFPDGQLVAFGAEFCGVLGIFAQLALLERGVARGLADVDGRVASVESCGAAERQVVAYGLEEGVQVVVFGPRIVGQYHGQRRIHLETLLLIERGLARRGDDGGKGKQKTGQVHALDPSGWFRGRRRTNSVYSPGTDSTSSRPRCSSTTVS